MAGVLVSIAALAAALAGHRALTRAARRRVLAQPRRGDRSTSRAGILLLAAKVALWLAALAAITQAIPELTARRQTLFAMADAGLRREVFRLEGRSFTALDLLTIPLLLGLVWLVASALVALVTRQLVKEAGVDRGAAESLATIARYTLIFLGAFAVLQARGIDARSVALGASVLGVGIGFGLQHIASNLVSGILIGLERPISPGDFVEVDEVMGTVERIGARSTQITTRDQLTVLVPNSRFLEKEVVNWSHGDPVHQLRIPVHVAYGSPAAKVRSVLLDAARSHPRVLAEPRPKVEFTAFAESSLHFELLVFSDVPADQHELKSDLNYRIEAAFRAHGIGVPFPQRDVHLSAPALERVALAWARRVLGEDALGSPDLPAAVDDGPHEAVASWADTDLDELLVKMRGPEGVSRADRRHLLKTYPDCFVGSEAVDWIVRNEAVSREEAVALGRFLVDRGVIRHVLDEHTFEDARYFYRFAA